MFVFVSNLTQSHPSHPPWLVLLPGEGCRLSTFRFAQALCIFNWYL